MGSSSPVLLKLKPEGSSPVPGEPALPSSLSGLRLPGDRALGDRALGDRARGLAPLHSWLTLTALFSSRSCQRVFWGQLRPGGRRDQLFQVPLSPLPGQRGWGGRV